MQNHRERKDSRGFYLMKWGSNGCTRLSGMALKNFQPITPWASWDKSRITVIEPLLLACKILKLNKNWLIFKLKHTVWTNNLTIRINWIISIISVINNCANIAISTLCQCVPHVRQNLHQMRCHLLGKILY